MNETRFSIGCNLYITVRTAGYTPNRPDSPRHSRAPLTNPQRRDIIHAGGEFPETTQMQSAKNRASARGTPDALRNATERDFSPAA